MSREQQAALEAEIGSLAREIKAFHDTYAGDKAAPRDELNAMLAFVEQLSEVNVDGVEPMTSVTPMEMKKRADVVNDGEIPGDIVRNAPETQNHFFLVPKVVE